MDINPKVTNPANRVLAFSSSRAGTGGFLESAIPVIKHFLGDQLLNIAFIPFAAVGSDYETYGSAVKNALASLRVVISTVLPANAKETIGKADVIMVGGGNTFKLLHDIYDLQLRDIIRDKVNGGAPYIGWSAGSNITGPTIGTTNDMPIIEPESFKALRLLPFQINPHYTNAKPEGHYGETRDQRLEEFISLNPGVPIIGLPEGTALKKENGKLEFMGPFPGVLMYGKDGKIIRDRIFEKNDLSFLLK